MMNSFLEIFCQNNQNLSPDKLWDLLKYQITKKSAHFAAEKSKECKKRLTDLNKKLQQLYEDQCLGVIINLNEQYIIKEEINNIHETGTKSTMFRAKARWHGEGEKSTKY